MKDKNCWQRVEQEPQMRICPNWKTCEYRENIDYIHTPGDKVRYSAPSYWHCDKHPHNDSCRTHMAHGKFRCPACIPYEPEQCPECGHPMNQHKDRRDEGSIYNYGCFNGTCKCKLLPADLQPEKQCSNCKEPDNGNCACMRNICIKCGKPVGNITFTVCDDCWDKEYPEPPVQQMPLIEISSLNQHLVKEIAEQQRDADMAWHNEQIAGIASKAVKEFKKKILDGIEKPCADHDVPVGAYTAIRKFIIRAMAGGKE